MINNVCVCVCVYNMYKHYSLPLCIHVHISITHCLLNIYPLIIIIIKLNLIKYPSYFSLNDTFYSLVMMKLK